MKLFPALLCCCAITSSLSAQAVSQKKRTSAPANRISVDESFYPMVFEINIDKQNAFIPLAHIESFGVQQYLVGKILVTDLTITLKSKTFIRIYAMQNGLDQPNVVRNLKDKVGLKEELVVKEYPLTTHKEMMEFRVTSMEQVEALRKELKKTYLQFLMKDYVKEHQKASVVTVSPKELVEVNADGKPKNDDDPDLIPDNQ